MIQSNRSKQALPSNQQRAPGTGPSAAVIEFIKGQALGLDLGFDMLAECAFFFTAFDRLIDFTAMH